MIKTLDTSATPKAGEKRVEPKTLAQVNVSVLRTALDASLLAAEAHSKPAKAPSEAEIGAAEQRGYERGFKDGSRQGSLGAISAAKNAVATALSMLDKYVEVFGDTSNAVLVKGSDWENAGQVSADMLMQNPNVVTKTAHSDVGTSPLSPSAQKIVDAIKSAYPIGISLVVAAKRAGLSPRSSAYLKHMREAATSPEIIERADGRHVARAQPNGVTLPPGTAAFKAKLPPSYAKMLAAIENHRGHPVDRETVAQQAGVSPTSSGLGTGLRELLELDLIVKSGESYALSPDFIT